MSERKQPAAGKGDKPRTVNNKKWRDNYDQINWGKKPSWQEARADLKKRMTALLDAPPPSLEKVTEQWKASANHR